MRKITLAKIGMSCALAVSLQSHAEDVTFTGFVNGSESVDFSVAGVASGTALAGGFATILNGGPSFETYCVDVAQHINFGTLYPEYTGPTTAHLFASPNAANDLGRLYQTAGTIDTSIREAAFQIAVWEIAFETGGTYDLSSGSATFGGGTAASSGALTLASSWLAGLTSGGHPSITVLESQEHQDVIFVPVPEPETYALLMAGLAAVGFVARRRKA